MEHLFLQKSKILKENLSNIKKSKIFLYWNTVYKFNKKLVKHNVTEIIYNYLKNDYMSELDNSNNIIYTDTTLILNNLGIDLVGYNPQLKKHKTTKVSI